MKRLLAFLIIALGFAITTHAGFDGWSFNAWTLSGDCQNTRLAPIASVSPTSIAFGNVSTGAIRKQTFTLTNTGTDTLNSISHSMVTGTVFTNISSTCSTLEPGQSCTWQVKFAPVAAGAVSDTSRLSSTLPDVDVAVSGIGVP